MLNAFVEVIDTSNCCHDGEEMAYVVEPDEKRFDVRGPEESTAKRMPLLLKSVTGKAAHLVDIEDQGSEGSRLLDSAPRGEEVKLNDNVHEFVLGQQKIQKNKSGSQKILLAAVPPVLTQGWKLGEGEGLDVMLRVGEMVGVTEIDGVLLGVGDGKSTGS